MTLTHPRWTVGALTLATLALTGCFSTSQYHTAETLPEGQTALGFGWGATQLEEIAVTDADGKTEKADLTDVPSLPNIIPDVIIRYGLQEDLELGAKLFLVGAQLDLKWRFLHDEGLSLALDPTVTYARPFLVLEETTFALPLLFTYRFAERFGIYLSGKIFTSNWSFPASGEGADEVNNALNDLFLIGYGATAGVSIDFKRFWIRPEFNYVDFLVGADESAEEVSFKYSSFGVAFGFNFGVDEERIQNLEERLDNLEKK